MSLKDWALIFGVVAVALAGILLFGGGIGRTMPDPDLEISLLPQTIDGFALQEYLERVEPVLPGEQYSSVAFFIPADNSTLPQAVDRLGIMLYHFDAPESVIPALNLVALGNELESVKANGFVVQKYVDENAGQINVYWAQGAALVQILMAADLNPGADFSVVEKAALRVMIQVIRAQP